jgi:ribosomal protein L21E
MKKMKGPAKVEKVMGEYKRGALHSGKGGPVVKKRGQAIAVALSEAGMTKKRRK